MALDGVGQEDMSGFKFLSCQGGSSGLKLSLIPSPRLVVSARSHRFMQQVGFLWEASGVVRSLCFVGVVCEEGCTGAFLSRGRS